MKFFLIAALVILPYVLVNGSVDPTTVCFPDKFQTDMYYVDLALTGVEAIDFNKKLFVSKIDATGVRQVLDIFTGIQYTIQPNSSCSKAPLPPALLSAFDQCLPAVAKPAGSPTSLGLGNNSLKIQDWDIDYGNGLKSLLGFTASPPYLPVLCHIFLDGNQVTVHIHANHKTTVDDSLFLIPVSCL